MSAEGQKRDEAPPGGRFGELAVRRGLLKRQQVEEGLEIQAKQRHVREAAGGEHSEIKVDRLGEILKRRGYIDEQGVKKVLALQSEDPKPGDPQAAGSAAEKADPGESSEASKDQAAGKRRLGDFELLSKLGQGAMGAVYLARQVSLDREVAIKILPPDLARDQEFLERFRREARAAARLNHPNIVMAFDVGVASGYHYIAMEYVDGKDLEQGLKEQPNGRYTPRDVLKIARHMAQALETASAHGIVHRDIKPANILKHSDGNYKLTDLGLAARSVGDQRVTQTGIAVGTPFYISPEQAKGDLNVDVRSDIYSLGSTLYHLTTGGLPFPGDNAVVVMTRHITDPLKTPLEVDPSLPKALSRLIEKMMAKSPKDRHQTPQELVEDIELIEKGEVPLLKRARAKPKSSSGQAWSVGPSTTHIPIKDAEKLLEKGKEHPSPRKTLAPPPNISAHPRVSRYPAGFRKAKSTGPLSPARWMPPALKRVLLLTGILVAGLVVGMVISRTIKSEQRKPSANIPKEIAEPKTARSGPESVEKSEPPALPPTVPTPAPFPVPAPPVNPDPPAAAPLAPSENSRYKAVFTDNPFKNHDWTVDERNPPIKISNEFFCARARPGSDAGAKAEQPGLKQAFPLPDETTLRVSFLLEKAAPAFEVFLSYGPAFDRQKFVLKNPETGKWYDPPLAIPLKEFKPALDKDAKDPSKTKPAPAPNQPIRGMAFAAGAPGNDPGLFLRTVEFFEEASASELRLVIQNGVRPMNYQGLRIHQIAQGTIKGWPDLSTRPNPHPPSGGCVGHHLTLTHGNEILKEARVLINFDPPAELVRMGSARVAKAFLELFVIDTKIETKESFQRRFLIKRVQRNWNWRFNQATWLLADATPKRIDRWAEPGADGGGDTHPREVLRFNILPRITPSNDQAAWVSLDVTEYVRLALLNPRQNMGILLRAEDLKPGEKELGFRFVPDNLDSLSVLSLRDPYLRPRLVVTLDPSPEPKPPAGAHLPASDNVR